MIPFKEVLNRLFIILLFQFWTFQSWSQDAVELADNDEVIEAPTSTPSPLVPKEEGFLGYKKKHSLVYGLVGFGTASKALTEKTQHFEIGYEKSQTPSFKWGPFIEQMTSSLSESFTYPNTGYYENRESAVTIRNFGVAGRYGLMRYIDIHAGMGLTMTTMEVTSVDTDAPAASTAVGFSESYPMGLSYRLGIQVSKSFGEGSRYGVSGEMLYQESAVGQAHSVVSTSFNIIGRWFYNRK
ncbi:hypothetical protein [Bdellovibrio reynosensis]|uniref:Outer membrane protein beta-barrel domain-containing protein n=1 Tax=Bdellovibrio reynosensis TaxID=2835041 RepID=A0ABY4CB74_9BACT|nr:hypothetical protein [Bdellovibrio reynosensis]UOF02227.1 hypothetical protein MNR06_04595 [Bdellovibrio reynosensis]